MKEPKPSRLLVALIWWTGAGTVAAIIGTSTVGLLWPTMIHPRWLGVVVGAIVFFVLTGVLQGRQEKAREEQRKRRRTPPTELVAARADVARALRARLAQQAAQRPE